MVEGPAVYPGLTGRRNLRVWGDLSGGVAEDRIDLALSRVGLTEAADRPAGGYSFGMRQRLALASALLGDPEVVVLDEPANGLDPEGIRWLRALLRRFADDGRTVLVSSHVLAEVAQLADDAVIVNRGRFVVQSSVAEITTGGEETTRVQTPDRERLLSALAAAGISADGAGETIVVRASAARVGELAAANGVVLHELVAQRATLEEAFLELVSGEGT